MDAKHDNCLSRASDGKTEVVQSADGTDVIRRRKLAERARIYATCNMPNFGLLPRHVVASQSFDAGYRAAMRDMRKTWKEHSMDRARGAAIRIFLRKIR